MAKMRQTLKGYGAREQMQSTDLDKQLGKEKRWTQLK
jgi:hypothetical protein